MIESQTGGKRDIAPFDSTALRQQLQGAWMVNNDYNGAMAEAVMASGQVDLMAFGRPTSANPDLGRRLRENAPLNAQDPATLYGGDAAGYTVYLAVAQV